MKESYYFSHDYNARNDIKIKRLLLKHGMAGYGVFWSIIEELYNNANALPLDYETYAYELRTSSDVIKSIINDYDLFVINDEQFGSMSVQNRLDERDKKSKKARDSAYKRWNKSERNANAMQTHNEGNAIKERKGKEKKEKDNIIKEKKEVVFPFDSENFKTQWSVWKDYKRKEFGFKFKSIGSEQANLTQLSNLAKDEKEAVAIIHQSMASGWKGFFNLKTETHGQQINQNGAGRKFNFTPEQLGLDK